MVHSDFDHDVTLSSGYCYQFKEISNIKTLQGYDRSAADYIKQCYENIKTLKAYREQLFNHVQKIVSAPEKLTLEIWRHLDYYKNNRVLYDITLNNTIDGIRNPQRILFESYTGKQRREALARFEELKKQYPQAEIIDRSQKR